MARLLMCAMTYVCTEIDGTAAGAGSLADLLQSEVQPPSSASAAENDRLRGSSAAVGRCKQRRRSLFSWLGSMRAHAEQFMVHWLVDNLPLLDADMLRYCIMQQCGVCVLLTNCYHYSNSLDCDYLVYLLL